MRLPSRLTAASNLALVTIYLSGAAAMALPGEGQGNEQSEQQVLTVDNDRESGKIDSSGKPLSGSITVTEISGPQDLAQAMDDAIIHCAALRVHERGVLGLMNQKA